jgi:hypothetical protein
MSAVRGYAERLSSAIGRRLRRRLADSIDLAICRKFRGSCRISLVLASTSRRRIELLAMMNLNPCIKPFRDITGHQAQAPSASVRLAQEVASADVVGTTKVEMATTPPFLELCKAEEATTVKATVQQWLRL